MAPESHQSHAPQPARPRAGRRRQRSARLVVAVVLLVLATVLVGWAVVDNVSWLRAVAAVVALTFGIAATKITHSELLQTRRDAQTDRAQQARDYAAITERRTSENAAFAREMKRRIRERERTITTLEESLAENQAKLGTTTQKLGVEARRAEQAEQGLAERGRLLDLSEERAADAVVRVAELEVEIDTLRSEVAALRAYQARMRRASA